MATSPPASYEDLRIDTGSLARALWRRKARMILIAMILAVGTYFYLTTVTPLYEATASLLVEARDNTFTRATNEPVASGGGADDAAIESQVQLVQSRETLLMVIDTENLRDVAELNRASAGLLGGLLDLVGLGAAPQAGFVSDEALIEVMRDRLIVARERDSRVISVSFRAEDPALATRVANALAQAHVERRADLLNADTSDATVWLEREIQDMRARVSGAEAKVANYRVENDLFSGSDDTSLLEQQMSDVTAQISAAAERRGTAETKARLISGLVDAGEPVETIAEVRESPVVQQLAEQKASLQTERAELAATLLSGHPSIRALDAQIAELTAEIQAEGRRVARALESQARIEADLEQNLRDELARLKIDASNAQINGVTLAELEREAAAQRDLLNAFLIRYREAAARINSDVTLPDVRIVSTASQPTAPVYPQKGLLVVAVGMVALVLQAGSVVLGELGRGTVFVPSAGREDEEVVDHGDETQQPRTPQDVFRREPEPEAAAAPGRIASEPEMVIERVLAESRSIPELAEADDVPAAPEMPDFSAFEELAPEPARPPVDEPTPDSSEESTLGANREEPADPTPAPMAAFADEATDEPLVEPVERAYSAVTEVAAIDEAEPEPDIAAASDSPPQADDPIAALAALAGGEESTPGEPVEAELPATEPDESDRLFETGDFPEAFADSDSGDSVFDFSAAPVPASDEARTDAEWDVVAANQAGQPEEGANMTDPHTPMTASVETQRPDTGHATRFGKSIGHIAMHIAANAERLTVVASTDDSREDRTVAGKIAIDLVGRGLMVALVDAGGAGGELDGPGITDLAADVADFGDVVHRVESQGLYLVPWGRQPELDLNSNRIGMLLEALGETNDHVIVMCGPMGEGSAMPWFAETGAALVLASKSEATVEQVAQLSNQARHAGFGQVSLARSDSSSSEVA